MGIGHFPKSTFQLANTARVVEPGTTVYCDHKRTPRTINKGVLAFTETGTVICVREDFTSLQGAIQGIQEV